MANAASQITLSSGQILFADPTKPWTPENFPNLPSTALSLTTAGTIATRNISTLTFSNAITYANYEQAVKSQLTKSLVINASGDVSYDDPKVSLVSTSLGAFNIGISNWVPSSIGGAGITSNPADSLTNAIAKLDSWIGCNLLSQPPSVSITQKEETSLYGGVRWSNFKVYNLFQYTIPYTTSMNFILGEPTSGNYLSLQLTNPDWFPDKQFTDGLAADFYPIVRLRVFNSFFPFTGCSAWSKSYMQGQCVRILDESGTYALPATGKVFALETYPSGDNYNTINLYLPQVPTGQNIPLRIIYLNKTQTDINVATTSTIIQSYGPPSGASSVTQTLSTPTSFTLQVTPPIYSDVTAGVSSCYFSSYNIGYTASQLNRVRTENLGFRYGFTNTTSGLATSYLSSYITSTFTAATAVQGGFQNISVSGTGSTAVLPGIQWSTTINVTNSAELRGSTISALNPTVSAFPERNINAISSSAITITSPWAVQSNTDCAHISYNNGWTIGAPLSTNLLYLSSSQLTTYELDQDVEFNDYSFPGCRCNAIVGFNSNMRFTSVFKDIDGVEQTIPLTLSSVANVNTNFFLNSSFGAIQGTNYLSTILSDTQSTLSFQNFYYKATVSGAHNISTIGATEQSLAVQLQNYRVNDYATAIGSGGISQQTYSTVYTFITEGASTFQTSSITYASNVSELVQISGLYTPTTNSELLFDLYASNFIANYANFSSIGMAQLYFGSNPAGPIEKYTSSVRIYQEGLEITSLPFPQNSTLHLSACTVTLTSNVYQDPADTKNITIYASATPANPVATHAYSSFIIGSTIFIDTVSYPLYSTFTNMNTSNGQRVISMLPRFESPGTTNDMNDGIAASGQASNGIDVNISSYFVMGTNNNLTVSSSVIYNNTSSISTVYTSSYSRELLFTNGAFVHPGGLDFSQFEGNLLGAPGAIYPDFTNDLSADVNYGNRYASFIYFSQSNAAPTTYQYVNICVRNPSALSTITNSRTYNYAFPNAPVPDSNMQYSKVRLHMKVLGAYNEGVYTPVETAWINCLKPIDYGEFSDSIYDVGGCVAVSTSGADVYYKVQMDRRYFTSIYPLIRVGISRDGSAEGLPANDDYLSISFAGINVSVSDS